jgi:hypothetical protein
MLARTMVRKLLRTDQHIGRITCIFTSRIWRDIRLLVRTIAAQKPKRKENRVIKIGTILWGKNMGKWQMAFATHDAIPNRETHVRWRKLRSSPRR